MRLIVLLCCLFMLPIFLIAQTITTLAPTQTSACAGGNVIIEYDTDGNFPIGTSFIAQLSNAFGAFNNPVNIGSMPINSGTIVGVIPSGTSFGINYRVRVVSSNNVIGSASPDPPIIITSSAISATIVAYPSTEVCDGQTVTLTANYNERYFWSTGDTTQSIVVTQSGNYSVTVTNFVTNCQVSATPINITVNPLPSINLGHDTLICQGQSLVLQADSTYSIYNWNNGMSYAPQLTVTTPGTYHVRVIDANGCQNRDTIHVDFTDAPQIDLGNDTAVCEMGLLLDPGHGYAQYNWNDGLSTWPTLWVTQSGTYHVLVKDTGVCESMDTIYVEILGQPQLNLGNDLSACGNNVTLNAGSGFISYDWNNGTGIQQFFNVTSSGTYFVWVSDSNNCTATDSIYINLFPVPYVFIGNDTAILPQSTLILDAGNGFNAYYWSTGNISQSILFKAADWGIGSHTLHVTVSDSNGCNNTATIIIAVSENAGLGLWQNNEDFLVFPLPFSEKLYIQSPYVNGQTHITLLDISGRKHFPEYIVKQGQAEISRGAISPGIYVLIIENGHTFMAGKIVIL